MPRGVKKSGVNQSEAIREQLEINPKAMPSEIKQALAAKGIKPSDSLISAVKYRKTGKKKGRKRGRPAATVAAKRTKAAKPSKAVKSNSDMISIDALVAAGKLVESLGGIDNAIKTINALKRVRA
jgi:hypothetical protein